MHSKRHCLILIVLTVLIGIGLLLSVPLQADELERQRIRAGLDLFPALLAADADITEKTDETGALVVLLVYRDNAILADTMAGYLQQTKTIRNLPLTIQTCSYENLKRFQNKRIAGICILQPPSDTLRAVIHLGQTHRVVTFSPFKGDVKKGMTAGIIITDIIKPYLNIEALEMASIKIKPFFLKVAERYGD